MQIETSFVAIAFTSVIGLQGWILKEVVSLKVNVATITTEHNDMKKRINQIMLLAILAPLLCLFAGCSSTGGVGGAVGNVLAAPGKLLDKAAQAVSAVTTNVVTSVSSNGETVTTTNLTAIPAPIVTKSENAAKTLADFLPAPYAQGAELALGGVTALLGLLVRRRQKQLDGVNADLNSSIADGISLSNQLAATIQGVENAVKNNVPVKAAIAKSAAKAGVADELNATVQATV
jgi:hypothetical protein